VTSQTRIIFVITALLLVGGWGFLMFRYPELFAKINVRIGLSRFATPRFIKITKWIGMLEMILAGLAAINGIVLSFFGLKW
jgi:hypothetical protein